MTQAELRLLARATDADVFAIDSTRVLRRYRTREVPEREIAVMRFVGDHGYPVPEVLDVSGNDLIMERIDGPTMVTDLTWRPWRVRRHARMVAALLRPLHRVGAPAWLGGEGPVIAHFVSHPLNVQLGAHGPVVIDWANAHRDDPAADVALTLVIPARLGCRPAALLAPRRVRPRAHAVLRTQRVARRIAAGNRVPPGQRQRQRRGEGAAPGRALLVLPGH